MAKKMGYQAFLEDQKKKEQEQAKGQVRFREASAASRIQYTDPSYTGKSKTGNYKWETEALKTVKMPKGSPSRTYNAKFDYLTKQMGLSSNEADDFRKYMDFQEDQQKVRYQKRMYDHDKNGKQLRTSTEVGPALNTKSSIIDNILSGMTSRAVQSVKDSTKKEPKAKKPTSKAVMQGEQTGSKKGGDSSFWSKAGDKALKALEIIDRPGDAVRTGIKEKMDGNSFWQGAKEGFTGEKNTSGTELNKRLGFDPKNNQTQHNIAKSVVDTAFNSGVGKLISPFLPDDIRKRAQDLAANEVPGMATEIALDPLNVVGGGVTKAGKALSLPRQTAKLLEGSDLVRYSDDALKAGAEEAARGVASPYVRQLPTQHPSDLVPSAPTMNDFVPNEIPQANVPSVLDDLLNFAQSGQGPQARGVSRVANPARFAKENVSNQADTILNRLNQVNGPTDYNQRILDVQKAMQDVNNNDVYRGAQQAMDGRQSAEDAFVEKYLAPHVEKATQEANGHQAADIVKGAKEEIDRIKGTYGKIKATAGEAGDYKIPHQFRAGVNNMAHDDLHNFATQEGFSSVDEAAQYLQQLDEMSKTKPTKAGTQYTEDFWNNLENEARQTFRQTDEGKALDEMAASILSDKPNFDALYNNARTGNDPQSFDELVKLAQMQSTNPDLKTLLRQDPKIRQALDQLNALGGKTGPGLGNIPQPAPSEIDDILKFLSEKENVNNSQAVGKAVDQLISPEKPTNGNGGVDNLLMNLRGEVRPKSEPNVTKGVDSEHLLGLNLQQHNTDTPALITNDKPIESVNPIGNIKNPVKRALHKFYEGYVDRTHSAKVAHTQVLENAIKKAEANGLTKKAEQLKGQLASVKKSGSDLEKAIQNEPASAARAATFLEGHIENLQNALGSTKPEDMANAIRYQVARNIKWIWKNVNEDYQVPGWDKGTVNSIINEAVSNPKLKDFTKAMKELTQERLDLSLKYNLINKEAHAALSKNPEYIPMARDVTNQMDNVARGLKGGTVSNKRTSGAYFIQSLGNGDAEALLKDPLETLMSGTFSLFKNMAKADTEKQFYNLAKLDHDNLFSRMVTKKEFDKNGGIAVSTPGGTKYIQVQKDLLDMVKENDLPYDLNVIGKITSAFAGAKTRSLEYHMTGAPRDILEGYLKGQTNNPITYVKELVKAAKEHNISAKQAGAYFDKAYKDGMNGINPEKMMKEYAKQNKNITAMNFKSTEGWKELGSKLLRIADMPFAPVKKIGQLSDELPRTVEIKATEKAFMKENGAKINNIKNYLSQVNEKLAQAEGIEDPFDPRLQGIDKLKGQKAKLENMLNEYDRKLQSEITFRGRDLMNFGNSGRSGAAKHLRQYFIFANTTTQSKDKLVRSFIERPVQTLAKTALITAPFVYAEQVLQQNLSGQDKQISDNLPYWLKQYNYTYVMDGHVYTVPKIQELALLTNPIEAILSGNMEDLNDTARLAVKESVPYQLGNVAQGLVPNTDGSVTMRDNAQLPSGVWSPAADVIANDKLGFNRNAISFADKFGKENPKANKFTLDLYKDLFGNKARADYAQYLATQYPGDAGKYASYTLDYLLNPTNTDKLDEMLQNLNPLQDRAYSKDSTFLGRKVLKNPPKKPAVDK